MHLHRILVPLGLVFALCGCKPQRRPDDVYRAFAAAARAGDASQVYGLLSEHSRASYDAQAKALALLAPGIVSSGRDLVLGDLSAGAPRISKVVVLRESPDAAVVGVTAQGSDKMEEVRMVREGGSWRVVLPDLPVASP